eukprot:641316-Prymnesium_polylepis.1
MLDEEARRARAEVLSEWKPIGAAAALHWRMPCGDGACGGLVGGKHSSWARTSIPRTRSFL